MSHTVLLLLFEIGFPYVAQDAFEISVSPRMKSDLTDFPAHKLGLQGCMITPEETCLHDGGVGQKIS